jgi:hypothetical protein
METLKWPNKFEQINNRLSEQHQLQRITIENEHIINKSSLKDQIEENSVEFDSLKKACKGMKTSYFEPLLEKLVSNMN